jgi:hypothetical protein
MKKWIVSVCEKGTMKYFEKIHIVAGTITEVFDKAEEIVAKKGYKNYYLAASEI